MDQATLEMFKQKLMGQLFEQGRNHWENQCKDEILSDVQGDEADLVALEREMGMTFRLKNRNDTYVKKIKEALNKIEEGHYGSCEDCGGEISFGRLQARPTAHLCIQCKEDQEKGEGLIFHSKKFKSSVFEMKQAAITNDGIAV